MAAPKTETADLEEPLVDGTLGVRSPHSLPEHESSESTLGTENGPERGQDSEPFDRNDMNTAVFNFLEQLVGDLAAEQLDLPSLPDVVIRIRKALLDEDSSVDQIARLIGSDPVFAARMLKIANSALFYCGTEPIRDLKTAVNRMGYKLVLNVSLAVAVEQFSHGNKLSAARPYLEEVWRHSVQVAAIAHIVARQEARINADEAFLAGLLHAIGKLYILKRAQEHQDLFEHGRALEAIMAAWHAEVGRALIEHWEFSEELAAAVGDHESCDMDTFHPASLTEVVSIANRLANTLEAGPDDEDLLDDTRTSRRLNLDQGKCAEIIRDSQEEIRALHQALKF